MSNPEAYTSEQMARLAFAVHYSANLCAPQNIAAVIKEIDTCGNDCEYSTGSFCHKEQHGDYCPFSLAEDLRNLSAALFGTPGLSGYREGVWGPGAYASLLSRPSPPVVDGELPQWNDLPEPTRVALCSEAEFYAPHIGGDAALGIYNKLRALLASQPQSPRIEGELWQPIETAPRDGTCILGAWKYLDQEKYDYGVTWYAVGTWHEYDEETELGEPSLWQPLHPPKSPRSEGDK